MMHARASNCRAAVSALALRVRARATRSCGASRAACDAAQFEFKSPPLRQVCHPGDDARDADFHINVNVRPYTRRFSLPRSSAQAAPSGTALPRARALPTVQTSLCYVPHNARYLAHNDVML